MTAGILLSGLVAVSGCGATEKARVQLAGSAECPHEQSVVRRALERSHLRVDVTGDGKPDTVAAASDPGAAKPCRGFVSVHVNGAGTYSTHLIPAAVPIKGIRARVIGLPHLGQRPGADIVVDTGGAVDAVLAQMFTFSGGRLRAVHVPDQPDGSFIVVGGGLLYPRGAGCTADGRLVLSQAAQTKDGKRFRVTRRTYHLLPGGLRFASPAVEKATVPVSRLGARFPEFVGPHWTACTSTPA
ncbi:MAG: hypothetical protein ACXVWU_02025 [Nocardioides sp.]